MSSRARLRVVFMGTPAFALPVLEALLEDGYDIVGVYTQPDRQSGRGKAVAAPAVKRFAMERGLPVFQPSSLRRDEGPRRDLASLRPDVVVVAAYGLLLDAGSIALPRLGCLNVHPSLLPRYRGPSPVASAILNGDAVTGVTIMQIDTGMDSGPTLAHRETEVGARETADSLTRRLFTLGARLLTETLPRWGRGELEATPQDDSQATITRRLSKADGEVRWSDAASYIERQVRAYQPWPGSFTRWRGRLLKIAKASAMEHKAASPGTSGQVVSLPGGGAGVVAGEGILVLEEVQLEGARVVSARDFVLGYRDFVGSALG